MKLIYLGTHDSETSEVELLNSYNILVEATDKITNIANNIAGKFSRTQNLNIKEQLKHGIRYFDLRLSLNDKNGKIFLSHGNKDVPGITTIPCINKEKDIVYDYLYLLDVMHYFVDFLKNHKDETIIAHIKREYLGDEVNDKMLNDKLINEIISNIEFKDYIYYDNIIPKLKLAKQRE